MNQVSQIEFESSAAERKIDRSVRKVLDIGRGPREMYTSLKKYIKTSTAHTKVWDGRAVANFITSFSHD